MQEAKPLGPVLPRTTLSTAAIFAIVLLGIDCILRALFSDHSGYQPFWTMAAIFMGRAVLHWPAIFDFAAMSAAWTALFIISIGYVIILGWLVLPWNWQRPLRAGAAFGVFFYFLTLFSLTIPFPWLSSERNWTTLVSYIVTAGVAACLLKWRQSED